MPISYKVLGQVCPPSGSLTTLYTVPSSTQTIASTLSVCNIGGSLNTYRVAVRPSGSALSLPQYLAYDTQIAGNDAVYLTLGLSLASGDIVSVYTPSNSGLAFNLYGSEIT
jgi:hypothetical protein